MKPATIPSYLVSVKMPRENQRVIFETRNAVYIGVYYNKRWNTDGNFDEGFETSEVISWAQSPFLDRTLV